MEATGARVFVGVRTEIKETSMFRSIGRVALGAALAGTALAAVPALASASPCTYNPTTKVASVVDSSGVNQLRVGVDGNLIFTKDGGNVPLNGAGGGTVATTANTDRINVFAQAKGASEGVVLDQAKGAFAPGATPEADGNSEIELALSGQSGHLSVLGTPGNDTMSAGAKVAVRLPRSLAGKTLRVEVEAADRQGHLQIFSGAGVLKVAR
jgi:hypothetical protein